MVALSSAIQYGLPFGVILASIGILLSNKIQLWKEFKLDKKAVLITGIITIIGAFVLFPGDLLQGISHQQLQ